MSTEHAHILVVDDEPSILELISYSLKRQGFMVSCASDGDQAFELITKHSFDLAILDIMLPGLDGFELCKKIRSRSQMPLIFVSAKDSEIDKVVGLELGADDYLSKPFGMRELLARVKALLRRSEQAELLLQSKQQDQSKPEICSVSGISISEKQHEAWFADTSLELTPREFELLLYLMKEAGKVLSREDLLRTSWEWKYIVETKTVDTHIKRLRDKLKRAGADPGLIETVRGYGYRFKLEG